MGWDELKDTEQVPQGSRGHQGPDLSLHDHSFCNHCSPSFLQLLSDDAFSLFHSPHQPHYAPFVLCSDFPKENADFYPSEATAFSCSLYLKTSHLSPVLSFRSAETQLQGHIFNTDCSCLLLHISLRWEQLVFSSAPRKGNLWTILCRTNVKRIFHSAA